MKGQFAVQATNCSSERVNSVGRFANQAFVRFETKNVDSHHPTLNVQKIEEKVTTFYLDYSYTRNPLGLFDKCKKNISRKNYLPDVVVN